MSQCGSNLCSLMTSDLFFFSFWLCFQLPSITFVHPDEGEPTELILQKDWQMLNSILVRIFSPSQLSH